jgi:hypothetical protein
MKKRRRLFGLLNLLALNVLFFALYLNFIHKDNAAASTSVPSKSAAAGMQGTVLVKNPELYLNKTERVSTPGNPQTSIN